MRIPEATQQFTLLYPRCWLGVKSKLSAAKIPRSPPARIRWACELIEFDTRIQAFWGEKLGTWIQRCSSSLSISVASLQCRSCRPLKWFIFSDAASERKGAQWWQHCPLKLSWVDQLWFRLKALQGLPPQGCCSGSWVVTDHCFSEILHPWPPRNLDWVLDQRSKPSTWVWSSGQNLILQTWNRTSSSSPIPVLKSVRKVHLANRVHLYFSCRIF